MDLTLYNNLALIPVAPSPDYIEVQGRVSDTQHDIPATEDMPTTTTTTSEASTDIIPVQPLNHNSALDLITRVNPEIALDSDTGLYNDKANKYLLLA